jgi:ribonuclease E
MGDVTIDFGEKNSENAILLLGAAEALGLPATSVRTGQGKFVVSEEIAVEAGLLPGKPAKKAAAKKAPAKKAAAKKSAAKKSTSKKSQE